MLNTSPCGQIFPSPATSILAVTFNALIVSFPDINTAPSFNETYKLYGVHHVLNPVAKL